MLEGQLLVALSVTVRLPSVLLSVTARDRPSLLSQVHKNVLEEQLLVAGRVLTLNQIQTKRGWMRAGGLLVFVLVVQLYFIASKVMQKRRHLRALEQVKKM